MGLWTFCSRYLALSFVSGVALGAFFTTLCFPIVNRMSACCWQKDIRFGHVQKVRSNFYQFLLKLKKNEWQGKNPTKWLWKNCTWNWVPDKVEALQNGSGVLNVFFSEHERKCLTIFGWTDQNRCGQKGKIVDREHHFVGSRFVAIPFCRLEKRSQSHFVDKQASTLQYGPPRPHPGNGQENLHATLSRHIA